MQRPDPEHTSSPEAYSEERISFTDMFNKLLPGVEFDEPPEMLEARVAVLEALTRGDQDPTLLRSAWQEYAEICEQIVDGNIEIAPTRRALLQIIALVHKALIFREAEDVQRYGEELVDAEEYALAMHFNEIAGVIGTELDSLAS